MSQVTWLQSEFSIRSALGVSSPWGWWSPSSSSRFSSSEVLKIADICEEASSKACTEPRFPVKVSLCDKSSKGKKKKKEQKMAGLRPFVDFPFLPQFLSGSRRRASQQAVWCGRDLKSLGWGHLLSSHASSQHTEVGTNLWVHLV